MMNFKELRSNGLSTWKKWMMPKRPISIFAKKKEQHKFKYSFHAIILGKLYLDDLDFYKYGLVVVVITVLPNQISISYYRRSGVAISYVFFFNLHYTFAAKAVGIWLRHKGLWGLIAVRRVNRNQQTSTFLVTFLLDFWPKLLAAKVLRFCFGLHLFYSYPNLWRDVLQRAHRQMPSGAPLFNMALNAVAFCTEDRY